MAGKPFDDKAKARLAKHIISGGKGKVGVPPNETDDEPDGDDEPVMTKRKPFLHDNDTDDPNTDGPTNGGHAAELPAVPASGKKKSRFADRFAKMGNKTGGK